MSFGAAMAAAEARIAEGSTIIPTAFGTLEYGEAGSGPPALMIHGTGGGFDQGLAFCKRLAAKGFRVIAPSRFGYLRSDFPRDPSSESQADAFVALLDHLGIGALAVLGGSAGALSAMQLAIRHPGRCSALVLIVPAAYAPSRPSAAPMSGWQEAMMRLVLGSDVLFWLALNLIPIPMIRMLLATDPAVFAAASPEEQARAREILWQILPVSKRSRGLMNDAALTADPRPMPLQRIEAPTIALSVEDDRFGTCDAARFIAAEVTGAKLVTFPTGGHIWLGHDDEMFGAVERFLKTTRDGR